MNTFPVSRLFAISALSLLILATTIAAQTKTQPPLIDRELFFGDPEISGAQISPDGKFIAFIKPFKGNRNIWVKRTEDDFSTAKPITADLSRPVTNYLWSRDGKFILFAQDKEGDENYNLFAVNPADPPTAGSDVPTARDLTKLKGVRVALYAVPRTSPELIYVGLTIAIRPGMTYIR